MANTFKSSRPKPTDCIGQRMYLLWMSRSMPDKGDVISKVCGYWGQLENNKIAVSTRSRISPKGDDRPMMTGLVCRRACRAINSTTRMHGIYLLLGVMNPEFSGNVNIIAR
jgi:hypothetical protein